MQFVPPRLDEQGERRAIQIAVTTHLYRDESSCHSGPSFSWAHARRGVLPGATWYNLLLHREWSRLLQSPARFAQEIAALPDGSWVVVDEVQRLPGLLDEVHELLSLSATRVRFALTGSSARKLRGSDVNLLAGRALSRRFFPLVLGEMGVAEPIDLLLNFGGLPAVRSESSVAIRRELLEAYRDTYLVEEVRNEGGQKSRHTSSTRHAEPEEAP